MEIHTARFGTVRVRPTEVIAFPKGIPPFTALSRYCLIELASEAPVQWLQCLEEPALAFATVNPMLIAPDYEVEITEADARDLHLRGPDDAALLVLLAAHENPRRVTANLRAPIVINHVRRLGKQVILPAAHYSIQHVVCSDDDTISTNPNAQEERSAPSAVQARRDQGCLSSRARSPRAS